MEAMTATFLTIADVTERTGKSASTVRRVIHSIVKDDAHPDRAGILPTPKEVVAHKKKQENFTWTIREDLLDTHFKSAHSKKEKPASKTSPDILSILQNELELKNAQIEKQWEVIHSLNERLREGNILMGSLQKRLSLPAAVDAEVHPSTEEASTDVSEKASKKRRWRWMVRS